MSFRAAISLALGLLLLAPTSQTIAAPTSNQATPLIKAYAQLPEKSLMTLSPNGERLAYRDITDSHDLLVILDMKTKKLVSTVQLGDVDPTNIYFVNNDQLILTASQSKLLMGYRGRHNVSAAFSLNLKTNSLIQLLTPGYRIYSGQTNVGLVVGVSPDNKYAYMPAFANASLYHLYKVNLSKKRKPKILIKGGPDTIDFFVDSNGNVLAREHYNNHNDEHRVESYIDGEWHQIFKEKAKERTKAFSGVTPDGKSLVMKAFNQEEERWAYYTISLTDGKVSPAIFAQPGKDVEHLITDINRVVYGVQYSGFKPTYEFFDPKLNDLMDAIARATPDQTMAIQHYTPDWNSILFYMDGFESSGDYLLFKDGGFNYVSPARPAIKPQDISTTKAMTIKARDELAIPTLLTLPNNKEPKNLPTIMLPHGGPESYDKIEFNWLVQYLSSQGYAVVQPQFRGSTGFGARHRWAGEGEWGRKMQHDLDDTIAYLSEQGITDPNRVCIVGSSYGGYAALAGVTFTPEIYKCAVSINGVSDINRMLSIERRKYGSHHSVVEYWDRIIKSGKYEADYIDSISPINFASKITKPILLIHGRLDQVVRIEQSNNFYDELQDHDKDVTLVELKKSNHHLLDNTDRIKALKAIDAFIKKHI